MKIATPYQSIILLSGLIHFVVSCETRSQVSMEMTQTPGRTLNLNFHDNILELNPILSTNESERFVSDLSFDRFFREDGSSSLFKSYYYDSIAGHYVFELISGRKFHDGSAVNTQAVKKLFKYLIENHFERPSVNFLFTSMDGFELINWYRENRDIRDSVPRGFQIINDTKFRLKLRKKSDQLIKALHSREFTLFKGDQGKYLGSGEFRLENLNEDISARLKRVQKSDKNEIETINISFTKNRDLVISEFFKGNLDLINYNPHLHNSSPEKRKLNKLLENKYPQFNVLPSARSIVRYAQINNTEDSVLMKKIMASVKIPDKSSIYLGSNDGSPQSFNIDSLRKKDNLDSSNFELAITNDLTINFNNYFNTNKTISYIETIPKNINPSEPHIVIKETTVDFMYAEDEKSGILTLTEKLQGSNSAKYLILDEFRDYVIYTNTLKGIEEYQTVSAMVRNMFYTVPKTY